MTNLTINEANMLREMIEKAITGAIRAELFTQDKHNIKIRSDGSEGVSIAIKQCLEDSSDE